MKIQSSLYKTIHSHIQGLLLSFKIIPCRKLAKKNKKQKRKKEKKYSKAFLLRPWKQIKYIKMWEMKKMYCIPRTLCIWQYKKGATLWICTHINIFNRYIHVFVGHIVWRCYQIACLKKQTFQFTFCSLLLLFILRTHFNMTCS